MIKKKKSKKSTKAKRQVARSGAPVGSFFLGLSRLRSRKRGSGTSKALTSRNSVSLLTNLIDTSGGKFRMTGTGGNPLGPPQAAFKGVEILYHRLSISESFDYQYLGDSGIYRTSDGKKGPITPLQFVSDFIAALEDGDPNGATMVSRDGDLYNQAHGAPHVVVKQNCFVVVEIVPEDGMTLSTTVPAIDTAGSLGSRYFDLNHIDILGDAPIPVNPGGKQCLIFYFSVANPTSTDNDSFNLYLQLNTMSSLVLMTVDPFIKNRGGH